MSGQQAGVRDRGNPLAKPPHGTIVFFFRFRGSDHRVNFQARDPSFGSLRPWRGVCFARGEEDDD